MADEYHVSVLKLGHKEWNDLRCQRGFVPDLSGEDLSFHDLTDINLSYANLKRAVFCDCVLERTNFQSSDLTDSTFRSVILSGTNLKNVNLTHAAFCVQIDDANPPSMDGANFTAANAVGSDFSGSSLVKATFEDADLRGASFCGADMTGANLRRANLKPIFPLGNTMMQKAILRAADLTDANLKEANLEEAVLEEANLSLADLVLAQLKGANMRGANLEGARLVKTDLRDARLDDCSVYGLSAWDVRLRGCSQRDLVIETLDKSIITVDSVESAQFIYLLLNNKNIRSVIDTITSKAVLILGRFTPDRKVCLEALRDELRKRQLLPILFDFARPNSRNFSETLSTLAHLAHFVIADITDAKSIPQELQLIIPNLPSVPVQPVILASAYEYGMFQDFLDFSWVLPIYRYGDLAALLNDIGPRVIAPAQAKAAEIQRRRAALEETMARNSKG